MISPSIFRSQQCIVPLKLVPKFPGPVAAKHQNTFLCMTTLHLTRKTIITILFGSSRILRLISGVLRSPGLCATDPGQRPVLVPSCDHVIVRHRTKSGDNLQRRRCLKNRQHLRRARERHSAVRGRGRGNQGTVDRRRVGRRGQGKARWHPRRKEVRWLTAFCYFKAVYRM